MGEIEITMHSFIPSNKKQLEKFLDYWGEKRDLNTVELDRSILPDPKKGIARSISLYNLRKTPDLKFEESESLDTNKLDTNRSNQKSVGNLINGVDRNKQLFDDQRVKRIVKSIPFDHDYQRKHTFKPEHTAVRGKSCDMRLRIYDSMKSDIERNNSQYGEVPSV